MSTSRSTDVPQVTGTAEREAPLAMVEAIPSRQRITLAADKNYDTCDFARELRELRGTPQVAQYPTGRFRAIDGRATHHPGYAISQRKRKQDEGILGWLKPIGWVRKVRHRGMARVGWMFTSAAAVYNLVQVCTLAVVA